MAMVVKNNMSAVRTLNTLNGNSSALQKSLAKVSSGMKINSAQDDASGYAISERMRVQIRSLDQANSNTQNASSLIKTAEGAVATTLEIVKTMKEKAINAATDTNTDADRATIQKELDQFIDQVDDNALVTFNGKILLDGSSMPVHSQEYTDQQHVVRALNSAWIQDSLDLIKENYGIDFQSGEGGTASAKYLDIKFVGGDTGEDVPSGKESAVAWCGSTYKGDTVTLTINLDQVKDIARDDASGNFSDNAQALDRVIAHELTHGIMSNRFQAYTSLPSYIKEGGTAELVHGADERVVASDTYLTGGSTAFDTNVFQATGTGSAAKKAYEGGYVAMRYFAQHANINPSDAMKKFMEVMDRGGSLDDAFFSASGGKFASKDSFETSFKNALDSYINNTTDYADTTAAAQAFLEEACGITGGQDTSNTDTGSIGGKDAGGKLVKTNDSVVHEVGSAVNWRMPSSTSTMIGGIEVRWPAGMAVSNESGGSMVFHVGAKANDAINIGFNDMRARAIGLYGEDGEKLNVTTQAKARAAIGTLDKVVTNVVNQQANIGAMLQRLEYTSANLTTSSENVQAAESTIRDADMAKEMTNYTKNNVLLQAAQSMLAQANQNSSAVLSLLQ